MNNINDEISQLLKEIFFKDTENINEYIPIIKNSNNISKIIPYLLSYNKNNEENNNYIINLIKIFQNYFKINNNLIPLFMDNSYYTNKITFYDCLITIYLKEYISEECKFFIEELMKTININYSISKNNLEAVYQNLSQYFRADAQNILTSNLLTKYLNLLNLMYSDPSSFIEGTKPKRIKNYLYFNGINSKLSFILNNFNCNHDDNFPTLEKGFSFVFWVKLDPKLIHEYFKILNNNIDINLIKINIGGELLVVKLISPKSIIISNKEFSTKTIEFEKLFNYDDWNSIIFTAEKKKNKLLIKLYINNNQINDEINFSEKMNKKEKINNIDLFENFLGKVSSILFFSFVIDINLITFFSTIKGFYSKKKMEEFLIYIDKDYFMANGKKDIDNELNLNIKNKLKFKLKDHNINNLICCFPPFSFDKKKKTIDDIFGNFIGKLGKNDGVNLNKNKAKHIQTLGGINNLLPIMELMFSSLKKQNPYKSIDNDIFNEKNFYEFLMIIQKILFIQTCNINESETKFFSSLSLFLEKIPSKFYTINILQSILNIFNFSTGKCPKTKNNNLVDLINLILLNEKIILKIPLNLQIEFWNYLYDFFKKNSDLIEFTLNISKICLFIKFYDEERYTKFCCQKHACLINAKEGEQNEKFLMIPDLNFRITKLFNIILLYINNSMEDKIFKDLFKILALDLSPCLQNQIILLYISHLSDKKVNSKIKKKTVNNLLKSKFVEICEYIVKISLLDTRILIFKLFNIIVIDYKDIIYTYLKQNSINISEIVQFFCFNILPTKTIIEIDKEDESFLIREHNDLFLNQEKIKEINKILYENFLDNDKKYIRLIDIFDKEEYKKDVEDIWNFFISSIKFTHKVIKSNKITGKNRNLMINPFILNFLLFFTSDFSAFYVAQFLIEILSDLKDDSIANKNIFYKSKQFFPWLLDTIFYFHNIKNEQLINDKNVLDTIKSMSVKIICDLFSHRRERSEIFKNLNYILEYIYFYKKIEKEEDFQDKLKTTRFILLKILEYSDVNIDIKLKIIFEFMFLFKNSETIFKEESLTFKEVNVFDEKEFFEYNIVEREPSDNWEEILNNIINDDKNEINEYINIDKNEENEADDNNNIEDINESELKNEKIISESEIKKPIEFQANDLIPNFFFEGINYNGEIKVNKNERLEKIWDDYKLFVSINGYYKNKLWGLKNLYGGTKKVTNNLEDKNFSKIVIKLFQVYGDSLENKNILVKKILKYVWFDITEHRKNINALYINIILLSIAIDISQNEKEKNELYFDYQQFLLFFILASINISSNIETKNKLNNKIYSFVYKFLYNIIGYGFSFIKKRDSIIYEKIKNNLISPIFHIHKKTIFCHPKKVFFKNSIIGKLFALKDKESLDDILLGMNLKRETEIKKHAKIKSELNNSQMLFESHDIRKLKLSKTLKVRSHISLNVVPSRIIKQIIYKTIRIYKHDKSVLSKRQIYFFYEKENIKGNNHINHDFDGLLNEKDRMEEAEKHIGKVIKKVIEDLNDQIYHYSNKSCLMQIIRKKDYKKNKKTLFSWNGFWSDKNIFYKHPEYLKLRIKNHFTKDMTKILLSPILDVNYYMPNFKIFDKNNLFNKDDYNYNIILNIDEILKLDEDIIKKEELEQESDIKEKNFINKNEIQMKEHNINENDNEILKNEIIINDKGIEQNLIPNNKDELKKYSIMSINSNQKDIQTKDKKELESKETKKPFKEKELITKKIHLSSIIINNSTKNIFYLKSLFKFSFKGIWAQYQSFNKCKINSHKYTLTNKNVFDLLIQNKLISSKNDSKYENIYKCCIVKPTHHIKGYISTENEYAKYVFCEEDEESEKLLQDDIGYDNDLHCCFGSTFKNHIKDKEKVNIKIYYKDIKYMLSRNYFYQENSIELYTFSNKSYFLNFKNNKDMQKFREDILNHETFRKIIGKDFNGQKILGYEKSFDSKDKILKLKEIMKDWKDKKISTLRYLMNLNIFSGRSFNDLTQYPVLPWIISNYHSEEIGEEIFRDLSIPIGMLEVNEESIKRKEKFIERYETLKNDFKEQNEDFNYKEFLSKGGEYLEQYILKKNKKKKGNKIGSELDEKNIGEIVINGIPCFYSKHYSCPTYVSHFLMRIFPFSLTCIEIHGNKFDDPERIFISLERTFETVSSSDEDIRELIPEFYTLPEMFLNKNNFNLTQNKLDSESKEIFVNDVELPSWSNNQSYIFTSELRKNLEKNELKINKWIDLIFGCIQRGEKAEVHHNIFMAQSYENMVKIENIADIDQRNSLMGLVEVGITPKQIFKKETFQRNERASRKWKYLYESKQLFMLSIVIPEYEDISKKAYKLINKENNKFNFPKIIKLKCIGFNEILLINEINYVNKIRLKNTADKIIIEEKEYFQIPNISSEYMPSFNISSINFPIILYNKNKYMIKGGFWDGRIEINSLIIDSKEKSYAKNILYTEEGPIIVMQMTTDEKMLICGTKTGNIICFSVNGLSLNIIKKLYYHSDEITSININDNLNMFATSSLDGYVNLHILPSFELVRSFNVNSYYENESNFYFSDNIFLSSSPLACITIYISSKRIFRSFTINGEFIEESQETDNSYIKSPIIFNDLDFQEYIIYGTEDGKIKIRKFPNMELINCVSPGDGNEIFSLDISDDKKYCYISMQNNKVYIIKDLYFDSGKDKKQILKINKELEKEKK